MAGGKIAGAEPETLTRLAYGIHTTLKAIALRLDEIAAAIAKPQVQASGNGAAKPEATSPKVPTEEDRKMGAAVVAAEMLKARARAQGREVSKADAKALPMLATAYLEASEGERRGMVLELD